MKLKTLDLDGKTYAEVADGKPVVIEDDGKETPFDFTHTRTTIARLNGESKAQREAREAAEAKLKTFEGIDDADAARLALETVKNLDQGQLVTAGKVEEIKTAARKAAEEQVAANAKEYANRLKSAERERDKYRDDWYAEKIGGAFSGSKFIKDKASIPGDLMQARFGSAFKVEEGKPVAYDPQGNKIFSRSRPGEVADFDEALESLVDQYPYRDQILKGTGSTGSGARSGTGPNGQRVLTRGEYDKLLPTQQREAALKGTQIVD